jgi:hypothetical protein
MADNRRSCVATPRYLQPTARRSIRRSWPDRLPHAVQRSLPNARPVFTVGNESHLPLAGRLTVRRSGPAHDWCLSCGIAWRALGGDVRDRVRRACRRQRLLPRRPTAFTPSPAAQTPAAAGGCGSILNTTTPSSRSLAGPKPRASDQPDQQPGCRVSHHRDHAVQRPPEQVSSGGGQQPHRRPQR